MTGLRTSGARVPRDCNINLGLDDESSYGIPTHSGSWAELGLLAILTRDVRAHLCDRDHINRHRYSVISVIVTLPHDFRLQRFKVRRLSSHRCATLVRSLHFIPAFDNDETLTTRQAFTELVMGNLKCV